MTAPGCVGTVGAAPPHFFFVSVRGGGGLTSKRRCAGCQAMPSQSSPRRRSQRAGELHHRREARLAAGALEQRDLGPVQVAAVAQLFLGDSGLGAGAAKVDGEALLRGHVDDSLRLTDKNSTDNRFPGWVRAVASATFQLRIRADLTDIYAESVERWQPMCYTRANNGTASDLTLALVAGSAAAKEES